MLLAALADGRAVDYASFYWVHGLTATRCSRPHIVEWALHLRAAPAIRHWPLSSARPPHSRYCAKISSSSPESPSEAEHSHAGNGPYPGQAAPAHSLDGP